MKSILVFMACVSSVLSGVRELTADDEREVLAIWQEICGAGRTRSDNLPALLGNNLVYCKASTESFMENKDHNIYLSSPGKEQKQVVFVQPPSVQYKHQLVLNGEGNPAQKTTIYVLPQKNTHTLQTTFNQNGQTQPNKPTVFFLKDKSIIGDNRATRSSSININDKVANVNNNNNSGRTRVAKNSQSFFPSPPVRSTAGNNGGGGGRFRFPEA